jgi:hypothetical protein
MPFNCMTDTKHWIQTPNGSNYPTSLTHNNYPILYLLRNLSIRIYCMMSALCNGNNYKHRLNFPPFSILWNKQTLDSILALSLAHFLCTKYIQKRKNADKPTFSVLLFPIKHLSFLSDFKHVSFIPSMHESKITQVPESLGNLLKSLIHYYYRFASNVKSHWVWSKSPTA